MTSFLLAPKLDTLLKMNTKKKSAGLHVNIIIKFTFPKELSFL